MIALRILMVTRKSQAQYSYSRVIDILVQSAALESFIMVVDCMANLVEYALLNSDSDKVTLESVLWQIVYYASILRSVVAVCVLSIFD